MFACDRVETQLILDNKLGGFCRKYGDFCPHSPGGELILTSQYLPWGQGKEIAFAKCTVVSVRPGIVSEFKKDKQLSSTDGFDNSLVWHGHLMQFYKGIRDDERLHHLTVRIDRVDKK